MLKLAKLQVGKLQFPLKIKISTIFISSFSTQLLFFLPLAICELDPLWLQSFSTQLLFFPLTLSVNEVHYEYNCCIYIYIYIYITSHKGTNKQLLLPHNCFFFFFSFSNLWIRSTVNTIVANSCPIILIHKSLPRNNCILV